MKTILALEINLIPYHFGRLLKYAIFAAVLKVMESNERIQITPLLFKFLLFIFNLIIHYESTSWRHRPQLSGQHYDWSN